MRLVDQSTRATIRTLTILAAATALLLTMFTFAPANAYAVSLGDWDTTASGPLPYTNFDDPDNNYGSHAPQATVKVHTSGNTSCTDLDGAAQHEVKFEVEGGSFVLEGDDNFGVVLTNVHTGTVTDGDEIRTWTFIDFVSPDQPVTSVFIKQATGGVWFNYGSSTSGGDHHLHSQDQGDLSGGVDTISHISFCFGDITPPPVNPTVTLVKTVDNTNGGTLAASDFPVFVNDDEESWGVAITVTPGEYVMSETQQSGYLAGPWGGDCAADGTLTAVADTNYTCTITNTAIAAQPEIVIEPEIVVETEIVVTPDVEVLDEVIVAPDIVIAPEVEVLDEVIVAPEVVVQDDVEAQPVVRVLDVVERLPATGLDTMRLALLSALIAGLGALFLLGTGLVPAMGRRRRG